MKPESKKILFFYSIVWIALNLIALLSSNCTWEKGMYYPQLFFPFSGYPEYFYRSEKNILTLLVYTYSYSEFIIYTAIGLVGVYFSKINNLTKNQGNSQSKFKESKKNDSNNSEITILTEQIRSFDSNQNIIKDTLLTLKKSLEQNLISQQKFDTEVERLKSEFDIMKGNKKKLKNIILAIENLQPEFTNLLTLKDKGIITSEEYVQKKDELIRNYTKKFYVNELELTDGRILQFTSELGYSTEPEVNINQKSAEDGFYRLKESDIAYKIKNSKILMEYYLESFKQGDDQYIEVGGNRINGITVGSPVWLDDKLAPDGKYQKGWFSKIQVIDGLIN